MISQASAQTGQNSSLERKTEHKPKCAVGLGSTVGEAMAEGRK